MTRINLIPVEELTDQHLIAEYRELPRIFSLVKNAQDKGKNVSDFKISDKYLLGTGHVIFFYNKLIFLQKRLNLLINECLKRGFHISLQQEYPLDAFNNEWLNDWKPDFEEINLSYSRISEKINANPYFYKLKGKALYTKK